MADNTNSSAEHRERQRQIEEKKQRLAELQAQRAARQKEAGGGLGRRSVMPEGIGGRTTMTTAEIHKLMKEIGADSHSGGREEAPSDPRSTNSLYRECNGDGPLHNHLGNDFSRSGKRPHQLDLVPTQSVSIQPRNENIQYCKTTQTDDERISIGEFSMGSQELAFDDEMSLDDGGVQIGSFDESPTREVRKHLKNLDFHHFGHQAHNKEASEEHAPQIKMPPLSEEEKRKILSSVDFSRYFTQASRVIERALAEDADIFIDYIHGSRLGGAEDKYEKSELLTLNRKIFDEKLTANRGVRAIDFSAFYPELVAVSYDLNKDAPLSPDSVINVWNTRFKTDSPEMTFHSSSRVTSMVLDPFQANIIIGGCYSGQICIWDTRVHKRMPVCKTSLSSNAHTQPVLCMKMVGSMNAHDLVTISTDGRLCCWSVDNLQSPIEASTNLHCTKTKKQMSALCMSFLSNSIKDFVVGSEDNDLYMGDKLAPEGQKVVKNITGAHLMPITSVDTLRASGGPAEYNHLCMSGSLDFCIKLWNLKDQMKVERPEPLLNLERKHKFYITDIQWSPVHPAVFVSLSADGTLNLWNLNVNTENPVTSVRVGESATKLRWTKNGQQLVVGDESGLLYLYDVNESLYTVRSNDWDELNKTLMDLSTVNGLAVTTI